MQAVLCNVDYTLMAPPDLGHALGEFARELDIDKQRLLVSVSKLDGATNRNVFKQPELWLAQVLAEIGATGFSPSELSYMLEMLTQFQLENPKTIPYAGYTELMLWIQGRGLKSAVVSTTNHGSRETIRRVVPGFDAYGFSCDSNRWNKAMNPQAYLDMSKLLRVRPQRTIVIEDNLDHAKIAKASGFLVIIAMNPGGLADRSRKRGSLVTADLRLDGMRVANTLEGAVRIAKLA